MVNLRQSLISTLWTVSTLCLLLNHLSSAQGQEATTTTSNAATNSSTAQRTYKIYHSFGQKKGFVPRGTITLSTESSSDSDKGSLTTVVENDADCFGEGALQDFDELVTQSGYYSIKVVDEENNGQSVLASVPGCEVKRANFREEIALSMTQTGSLLSVSYTPLVSPLAAECHELQPLSSSNREFSFQTLISYATATPGMALPKILPKMRPPPGLQAIKFKKGSNGAPGSGPILNQPNTDSSAGAGKPSFQSEEEEKMKQEETQSFFRKYWYIILPMTLMTFLGGEESQPPQQQQQRQAGAGAVNSSGGSNAVAGGAGFSAAAAPATTTTTRQRRGKRS